MGDELQGRQRRREIVRDDDNLGGVGADKGVVLSGETLEGREERLSRRDNEVEGR